MNQQSNLRRNILLIGAVGVGKSTLAREVAKRLDLGYEDPEEELRRQKKKRINEILEEGGSTQLGTWLFDLLLPAIESQKNSIFPCPPNLARNRDFLELTAPSVDCILISGMPIKTYYQVIKREIAPNPDYLEDTTNLERAPLLRAEAKVYFYNKFWIEPQPYLQAPFHVRVIGDLEKDTEALCQKIMAIQALGDPS